MTQQVQLTDDALELIAGHFRLLADPMRLKILHTLGENEMNVSDLVAATGAGQANTSKHLGILLNAGIVSRRKDGLNSIYKVIDETTFKLCDVVCSGIKKQLESRHTALSGL